MKNIKTGLGREAKYRATFDGKSYRMRKSQKAKLDYIVKKGLEEWLEGEEKAMSGRDYLKLLLNYKDSLERQR